jgi:LacI family transcriptional regulator
LPQKTLKPISLKQLAEKLKLSQSTVSRIVNGEGAAHRIAQETQRRVLQAAALHGYAANNVARSLRRKRTNTIGVIVPEISEGYSATVLSGVDDALLQEGFFYFVVNHRHRAELIDGYPRMMVARSVEGIIAVDTPIRHDPLVPMVAVSGHRALDGVVNIELDHDQAARLALSHLKSLGHSRIAFIKGQEFSSDTAERWNSISRMARMLEIAIHPRLVGQLVGVDPGPEPGIEVTRALLKTGELFTAIFAFNDITAIGAIVALREAGLRVPREVSVLGFDDVMAASISNPPLTTIRQPLRAMGQQAAHTLVEMIANGGRREHPEGILVGAELVVRKSTAVVGHG